jgi:hypothetical protein
MHKAINTKKGINIVITLKDEFVNDVVEITSLMSLDSKYAISNRTNRTRINNKAVDTLFKISNTEFFAMI